MNARKARHTAGALILGVLLGTPLAFSQSTEAAPQAPMEHSMQHRHKGQTDAGKEEMPAKCKAMMQEHQEMMKKCQIMDAKLDELAAAMNAATGQEKTEAMAALVNEMVQQRKSMHTMMMQMHKGMMSGMMGEMTEGAKPKCKMMKKMMKHHGKTAAEGSEATEK